MHTLMVMVEGKVMYGLYHIVVSDPVHGDVEMVILKMTT